MKQTSGSPLLALSPVSSNIIKCSYHPEGLRGHSSILVDEDIWENNNITYDILTEEGNGPTGIRPGEITAVIEKNGFSAKWMKNSNTMLREGKREFNKTDVMAYTIGGEAPVIKRVKTVDGERNFIRNLREVKDHTAITGTVFRYGWL